MPTLEGFYDHVKKRKLMLDTKDNTQAVQDVYTAYAMIELSIQPYIKPPPKKIHCHIENGFVIIK